MPKIPKDVHYIFMYDPTNPREKQWSLVHYVCVKSAVKNIEPENVYLYCENEPTGPWWELTKPLLTIRRTSPVKEIFGNPITHPAHEADVIRLEVLLKYGGIYLDIDVLVHKSFDDLLNYPTVMGLESTSIDGGIPNAVLLSEPESSFLRNWYEEYRWFRGRGKEAFWNEHSVLLPARLATKFPDSIRVLDQQAFFWPGWDKKGLKKIYGPSSNNERALYANHLWESKVWDHHLEHLTPGRVRRGESQFHRWCLPFLDGLPDDYGIPTSLELAARRSRMQASMFQKIKSWPSTQIWALGSRILSSDTKQLLKRRFFKRLQNGKGKDE